MSAVALYSFKNKKNCSIFVQMEKDSDEINYRKVPRDLYKYCSIDTAILILKNQCLRFSIPWAFTDKREGHLYKLAKRSLERNNVYNIDPDIDYYTCCFTTAKISEAFTQIYSAQALYGKIFDDKSLKCEKTCDLKEYIKTNSIGICFKFNRAKFKESLFNNLKADARIKEFDMYEGYMQYFASNYIDKLTNKSLQETNNNKFINSFCEYITAKNENFKYEEEFRFFIGMTKFENQDTLDFSINLGDCLDKIYVYTNSAVFSLEFLENAKKKISDLCNDLGIKSRGNKGYEDDLIEILNVNGNNFV